MNSIKLPLRLTFNRLMAHLPVPLMRGFLKTFELRQDVAERAGYHVHPRRFDSPLPIIEEIDRAALDVPRSLPAIDLRLDAAETTLAELGRYAGELDSFPDYRQPNTDYWLHNDSFEDFDAAALHCLLRQLKPHRYIEVGCGFSTHVSQRALALNCQEGNPCAITLIDPVPRLPLHLPSGGGKWLQSRVQDVPLRLFEELAAGDVLFIDTSHVLKVQSDVVFELTEVLPRLAPGVWVHVHDVFTPYDYPAKFVYSNLRTAMNEQYALECLLSGGDAFRIELPLYCLWMQRCELLERFFSRGRAAPHSLWLQRTPGSTHTSVS